MHRQAREEHGPTVIAELPFPGLEPEDVAWHEIPSVWRGPARDPHMPEEGPLGLGLGPDDEDLDLEPLQRDLRDHPRPVALEMVIRRSDVLKRRQLTRYGMDASGTLRVVTRGLDALEGRRRADGSFPAGGGRSALGQTGLALLPFLADGESSRTGDRPTRVVAHGIAWLRGRLFAADAGVAGRGAGRRAGDGAPRPLRGLHAELRAPRPGEAAPSRRGARVPRRSVVEDAQRPDGSFPGDADDVRVAVWPMWGLEAAVRTGAVRPRGRRAPAVPSLVRRLRSGRPRGRRRGPAAVARARRGVPPRGAPCTRRSLLAARPTTSQADPFLALTVGTGLLLHDADAFRTWNEELGERLLDALDARGMVREGDEVGDTALHLLALQAAYRTFSGLGRSGRLGASVSPAAQAPAGMCTRTSCARHPTWILHDSANREERRTRR